MGNKINPVAFRTGVVKNWQTRWFFTDQAGASAGLRRNYRRFLEEDELIRKVIRNKISQAGIAGIEIERTSANLRVLIRAARPGFVIGRGGKGIEELTRDLENSVRKLRGPSGGKLRLSLNVEELKRSEVSAAYVAQLIAWDMERRIPFRQTLRKQIEQLSQNREIKGARILVSGRLDGNEISRREWKATGSLPLQMIRADIDYGTASAHCSYGTVGVKVWVYRGEIFNKPSK
ncbi:MAG: 30S ribosomal protein S3 [Candidatus Liptonbacteria bacterium]|nr:30S ribosomal protein S3 [Candidatus Liptonbacteria bacterium]